MSRKSSIISVALLVLASESHSQLSLPWSFGFCTIPPNVKNFNASAYFTGKWYQQASYGDFLTQGVGICPTIDNDITQSGLIRQKYYTYQQLTMSYSTIDGTASVSDIQNGQGYIPITYGLLNGLLPYEAPIYIVGTDYDNWAVIFSCRQQLFLKLEMSWTLTRTRNGTAHSNIINQTIQNAQLNANNFVASTNVGCGTDEPNNKIMEEPKSDSDRGVDANVIAEDDWETEHVDRKHYSQPQDGTEEPDTARNPEPKQIMTGSSYDGWDEPSEVSIDDVNPGEQENVEKVAAGGRTPRLSLGGISRIVLGPDESPRQQPLKMKKSKKGTGNDLSSDPNKGKNRDPSNEKLGFVDLAVRAKGVFWTTADEYRDIDPEAYVIFSMRDVTLYVIFLIVTATIAFGSLAYAFNYYANILSELLTNSKFHTEIGGPKTFREIHRIHDIWTFINSTLLTILYSSSVGTKSTTTEDLFTTFEGITVLQQNIIVGAPRIRQVRVKNGTCSSAPMFHDLYVSCYDYYNDDINDKNTFGKASAAFQYKPPDEANLQYSGVASSYGEGGFMMNFSNDFEFNRASLKDMEDNLWIQIGSRAIFVDFTLYTPNANLFCVVKLVFEIIPAGGVVASSNIYALKLLRYLTKWDYFIASCEAIFICFAIYYSYEEIQQMKHMKESYLDNWWNILDFSIVLGSWVVIAIGLTRHITVLMTIRSKLMTIHTDEHASFEYLTFLQNIFDVSSSVLTFIIWLKIVKFSSLSRSVSIIISTFGRVRLELASLVLMTAAVVMGFALLGNALFGSHVLQFRTVNNAFFTLIGLFVGGLYFYDECRHAAPLSSQVYFVLYIFFVLVIFLSAFVAVIVFGFLIAVTDIDDVRDRVYLGDVCNQLWLKILTTFGCKKLATKLRAKQLAKLHMRDYEALAYIIRRHGYHGLDLELLLKNHDVKPGQRLNLAIMSDVYNDLTTRNQLHVEVEEHDKIMDHIDKINKTIEFLDLTLADIVGKVDILANKLIAGKK